MSTQEIVIEYVPLTRHCGESKMRSSLQGPHKVVGKVTFTTTKMSIVGWMVFPKDVKS